MDSGGPPKSGPDYAIPVLILVLLMPVVYMPCIANYHRYYLLECHIGTIVCLLYRPMPFDFKFGTPIALRAHFYSFASITSSLNSTLLQITLFNIHNDSCNVNQKNLIALPASAPPLTPGHCNHQ